MEDKKALAEKYKSIIESFLRKHNYVSDVTVVYKPVEKIKDEDEYTGEGFETETVECLEYDFTINPEYFPDELGDDLLELSYECLDENDLDLYPSDKIIESFTTN